MIVSPSWLGCSTIVCTSCSMRGLSAGMYSGLVTCAVNLLSIVPYQINTFAIAHACELHSTTPIVFPSGRGRGFS